MVNFKSKLDQGNYPAKTQPNNPEDQFSPQSLNAMCKMAAQIINQLFSPLDAVNRFINLALQGLEEGSQSRQFLVESKQGIKRTSLLLKRLNNYTKRIEREIQRLSQDDK